MKNHKLADSSYGSDLNLPQAILMMANHDGVFARLRKSHPLEIINAIAYIVRTGCQWTMLPKEFPNWKTVYHHFPSWSDMGLIKADMGYLPLRNAMDHIDGVIIECVKSNFGTPDFIPILGRWVVERTFSWMDNYRMLTRNYERLPEVVRHRFIAASVFFMLRYFA